MVVEKIDVSVKDAFLLFLGQSLKVLVNNGKVQKYYLAQVFILGDKLEVCQNLEVQSLPRIFIYDSQVVDKFFVRSLGKAQGLLKLSRWLTSFGIIELKSQKLSDAAFVL